MPSIDYRITLAPKMDQHRLVVGGITSREEGIRLAMEKGFLKPGTKYEQRFNRCAGSLRLEWKDER